MSNQKLVLYVDKANETREIIARELGKKFELETRISFGSYISDLIEQRKKESKPYDSLVTHVPYNQGIDPMNLDTSNQMKFYSDFYSRSLSSLRKIRENNPQMPIIAYTGTDDVAVMRILLLESVSEIVFKLNPLEDALKLEEAINKHFQIK